MGQPEGQRSLTDAVDLDILLLEHVHNEFGSSSLFPTFYIFHYQDARTFVVAESISTNYITKERKHETSSCP